MNLGSKPGAREKSPWANEAVGEEDSLFKGKWVKVSRNQSTAYAQWLDTGPTGQDQEATDYDYVFGDSNVKPKNHFGLKAGIDLSPTAAYALGFGQNEGSAEVTWSFIDEKDVPDGVWKNYPAIDDKPHWD